MQAKSSHQVYGNTLKSLNQIAIGLIEAGEAGGILEQVLDRIAILLEERAKIRGQIYREP